MTPQLALLAASVGVLFLVAGLTWALGPYALAGCGLALLIVALLVPVRERRGEPTDETSAP